VKNQRAPFFKKSKSRRLAVFCIPIITYIPYELKEEDEGHQHITCRACRKVYIYYYFAILIAIVLVTILKDIQWIPVLILALLGLGQYFAFWTENRKLRD